MRTSSPHPIVLSALLLTLVLFLSPVRGAERPNIVFLLADDQCSYSMGCYGNPDVKTPNLDLLARQGIVFDNHYDTTAICMASRANVMTGMLEYKTGCNFEHGPLMRDNWNQTYPVLLRKAGYLTAFAGKFGFVVAAEPGKRGVLPEQEFDAWGGGPGQTHFSTRKNPSMTKYAQKFPHSTRAYGAFGSDFIASSAKSGKPFCLSISFKAPHRPVTPDPIFDEVYAGIEFTKPANFGREYGDHFAKQSRMGRQFVRFHEWEYSTNYTAVMAKYHQQIFAIDVAVDMVRQALQKNGVADNTVIIYTSDNGFLCGSHGYGSKVLPYEEASRVPLILFDPRQDLDFAGTRHEALTGNVDMAPTILELAGVDVPPQMDGKSLLPLCDDPKGEIHEQLPLINVWGPKQAHSLSVVTRDWKYIYWPYADGEFEKTEELYHTAKDPLELKNLANDKMPDAVEALRQMRARYDDEVKAWKAEAVPYNDYRRYGEIFERS